MRYKGKKLIPDTDAELMIGIKPQKQKICNLLRKNESDEVVYDFLYEIEKQIHIELKEEIGYEIGTEGGDIYELNIRCVDITLNKVGLDILKKIYDVLVSKLKDVRIYIVVHIDIDNWFINEKGEDYNEDDAGTWEEFMKNVTEI